MPQEWSDLLKAHYGSLTEAEKTAAWEWAKENLQPGDWIEGAVVAFAPFGAWMDLGHSVRGLLLITRFWPELKPVGEQDPPKPGDLLRSRILSFSGSDQVLVLSQNPNHSTF